MNKNEPERVAGNVKPADVSVLIQNGIQHHNSGKFTDAETCYRRVLEIDPENPDANHLLGLIAHQMGESEAAILLISKAIRLKPDDAAYYENLAKIQLELGKLDDAVANFHQAQSFGPEDAETHAYIGNLYEEQGRLLEAVKSYRRAVAIKPDFAEVHYNLGIALNSLGLHVAAVDSYDKSLALNPRFTEALNNKGNALKDLGKLDDAAVSFKKAINENPNFAEAHFNLHGLHLNPDQMAPAIESMEKAVNIKPNLKYKFYLGACLDYAGEGERAAEYLTEVGNGELLDRARLDAWNYFKSVDAKIPHLFGSPIDGFDLAFNAARPDGLVLEFGVRFGGSIRQIANLAGQHVYGFDSFEGLQEDWHNTPKGSYSTGGEMPDMPENVTLIKGWFDQTLPAFLESHTEPARFINIDCDTYEATKTVFDLLGPQIAPGTIIAFDEYIGNPYWREDEFKSFQEAVISNGWTYKYLGLSLVTGQVVAEIL